MMVTAFAIGGPIGSAAIVGKGEQGALILDELFGRYRLRGLLGQGGMGQVFRAYDTELHREVAIKVLPPQMSADVTFEQRFRREARAAAGLGEPHVVPIHDSGEIDGRLFIAMQLIAGTDLNSLLGRDGPLPAERAVSVIEQAAAALDAAHDAGLVHRDVKPANLLLTPKDFVYLIDFGIAYAAGETQLTGTGTAIGTLDYMAPERFTKGQIDKRADIYALACVLHQCLTGQTPYPIISAEQAMFAHVSGPPPRPSQIQPGVAAAFDEVVAHGMASNPDQRYQSAGELASAARVALRGTAAPARPSPAFSSQPRTQTAPTQAAPTVQLTSPPARKPRTRWIAALAAAAILIAATVIAIGLWGKDRQHASPPAITAARPPAAPSPTAARPSQAAVNPFQSVVPFTELDETEGVAVDSAGSVYVTADRQVVKLSAGAAAQEVLPFKGLDLPFSIEVDGAGNVYVADFGTNQVLKLAAGSRAQQVLPFNGLAQPGDVAVDSRGNIYVPDHKQVLELVAGSSNPRALPSSGLAGPTGVAVDSTGNVYVTDQGNNKVFKLAVGSTKPELLPFTDLWAPWGIAVDGTGNLYVADEGNNRVLKLAPGSATPEVLPFTGLNHPHGLAADGPGNLYVADSRNKRVVKLAAH